MLVPAGLTVHGLVTTYSFDNSRCCFWPVTLVTQQLYALVGARCPTTIVHLCSLGEMAWPRLRNSPGYWRVQTEQPIGGGVVLPSARAIASRGFTEFVFSWAVVQLTVCSFDFLCFRALCPLPRQIATCMPIVKESAI
jgi:hypothetical protein